MKLAKDRSTHKNFVFAIRAATSLLHHVPSALGMRPGTPCPAHLIDERSPLQAEFNGSVFRAADHRPNSFKRLQNQSCVGVPQNRCSPRRDDYLWRKNRLCWHEFFKADLRPWIPIFA